MPGGGCRGGILSLGPGMTPGPGSVITGAAGDLSWLSVPRSEGGPLSPLESLVDSSGVFILPAGANFVQSNSVGMKGAPPGGMDVGDSMIGPVKAGGLLMGAAC